MPRFDRRGEGNRREPVFGLAVDDRRAAAVERDAPVCVGRSRGDRCARIRHLAGGEGPQIESKSGWDVDGVEVRVILDFGAGFIDWRGWYANAGA
jgi:hypothetical protein